MHIPVCKTAIVFGTKIVSSYPVNEDMNDVKKVNLCLQNMPNDITSIVKPVMQNMFLFHSYYIIIVPKL